MKDTGDTAQETCNTCKHFVKDYSQYYNLCKKWGVSVMADHVYSSCYESADKQADERQYDPVWGMYMDEFDDD